MLGLALGPRAPAPLGSRGQEAASTSAAGTLAAAISPFRSMCTCRARIGIACRSGGASAGWDAPPAHALQGSVASSLRDRARDRKGRVRSMLGNGGRSDGPGPSGGEGLPSAKPLKINRDLLIYNGRLELRKSRNTFNAATKRRLLDSAESNFRRVIAMDPKDARGYVCLGKLLVEDGREEEAARLYDVGCQALGGTSAFIWQAWATLESRRGNVSRARQLFDAATAADPSHAPAWHGWGMLEMRQGELLRARDLFVRGVRELRDPDGNSHLYHSLAMLCVRLGRPAEARQWFREGTETPLGAKSVALWKDWAQLEAEGGDVVLARRLFRRAIEANPRARHVYSAWAKVEKERGSREAARKLLETGVQLNRTDHVLLQALGVMEAEDGRLKSARSYFAKSIRVQPRHMAAWQAWAILEHQAGNADRARDLFRQALWCDPQSPKAARVFHAWDVMEEKEGNGAVARELFKCGVKCDPGNQTVWLTWAEMEERMGNELRAMELRAYSAERDLRMDFPPSAPDDVDKGTLADKILAPVKDWLRALTTAESQGQTLYPQMGLVGTGLAERDGGGQIGGVGARSVEREGTGVGDESGRGAERSRSGAGGDKSGRVGDGRYGAVATSSGAGGERADGSAGMRGTGKGGVSMRGRPSRVVVSYRVDDSESSDAWDEESSSDGGSDGYSDGGSDVGSEVGRGGSRGKGSAGDITVGGNSHEGVTAAASDASSSDAGGSGGSESGDEGDAGGGAEAAAAGEGPRVGAMRNA